MTSPSDPTAEATAAAAPRVLIVAPNASSRMGGEAFLPLKYFQILRRRGLPARLIAHERNRADLTETLGPWVADVAFVPDTAWHRGLWQVGRRLPHVLREAVFGTALGLVNEIFQRRLIRALVAEGKVDLIHQPIPVSPRAPSALHGFGVPVVIGPMNGGMDYPPGYEDMESPMRRRMMALARAGAWVANLIVPGKRRAAALLVANPRSRAALPCRHPRVIDLVENGVDLTTWSASGTAPGTALAPRDPGTPFRLVFMGRLVDWKAVDVTLQALALAPGHVTLDILGDGPERARLEALADRLGLAGRVTFHGFRPQADCVAVLRACDALILNSVWECGGAVVLEAMSLGLAVIASDWGGPADYLDADCGVLVAPSPRDSFAPRLAEAIARLAADPGLVRSMGAAGQARIAAAYDWERKVDRMLEIYGAVRAG